MEPVGAGGGQAMSDDLILYYNPMSRARIVHWMLEEVGAPYRLELLRFDQGENKKPGFLALNPMGKLPTLVHRNVVVTESAAICTYLADAFPAAKLAPANDEPARGTYLRWMFFGAGCVEPATLDRMFSRPPAERTAAVGYGTYAQTIAALEGAVTPGPYILGDRFTAADVYIGSQIRFGLMMKSIDPSAVFEAYLARLAARPAYRRADSQAETLLAQMKTGA